MKILLSNLVKYSFIWGVKKEEKIYVRKFCICFNLGSNKFCFKFDFLSKLINYCIKKINFVKDNF